MIQRLKDTLAFRGRLTRLGYWRWQLAILVVAPLFAYGAVAVTMAGGPRWLAALAFLPIALPLIASVGVVARRLHDRGRGAVWLALFMLGPWGLATVSVVAFELPGFAYYSAGPWIVAAVAAVGSIVINLWGLIEIGFLRGTPGPNRFGPQPQS